MISPRLLTDLADTPTDIFDLSPRQFEGVVAELLASVGWRISLAQERQDRGYDILGIAETLPGVHLSWLIQCKRVPPGRQVSIDTLKQLVGVATALQITNSMVVTTGGFSQAARRDAAAFPGLQLVDFSLLAAWLHHYRGVVGTRPHLPERAFQSCFLSHSSRDASFVAQLVAALRAKGIPLWFAPDDLVPGEHLYKQVKDAINAFDRLLIVLSESSLGSTWVHTEILEAFRRQQEQGHQVLFPVSLVAFDRLREWSLADPDTGLDIAREIRSYFVLDFSQWHDSSAFAAAVERLVSALHRPRDAA